MSPNQPSRRRRRSLITWGFIVVSAGIALVLGILGYAEYYAPRLDTSSPPSFKDLLYDSARLLVAKWDNSSGDTMPKTLQMARWFALLSWSAAAIKGLLNFASKQVQIIRCRLHRNHAIVCGLGRQGVQLVSDLTANGINVIVIELDPDNSQMASVRSEGVPVLMGNAEQCCPETRPLHLCGCGR
jgi:hypothetical protein